jgi:MFS family permease
MTITTKYLTWSTPLPDEHNEALGSYRNPTTWSTSSKVVVYGMSVFTTLMAAYSISAYVAGVDAMAVEFHSESIVVLIGMPTFQMGFAIGPMILAPLSEIHGRKPVFVGTYALFNGGVALPFVVGPSSKLTTYQSLHPSHCNYTQPTRTFGGAILPRRRSKHL